MVCEMIAGSEAYSVSRVNANWDQRFSDFPNFRRGSGPASRKGQSRRWSQKPYDDMQVVSWSVVATMLVCNRCTVTRGADVYQSSDPVLVLPLASKPEFGELVDRTSGRRPIGRLWLVLVQSAPSAGMDRVRYEINSEDTGGHRLFGNSICLAAGRAAL
jgi:hypothetical protein